MQSGYTKMMPVGIEVEAQMLESVAGYDYLDVTKELGVALDSLDVLDPDSIRWLASLLARRIDELEAGTQ